jgi:hypothetical protein
MPTTATNTTPQQPIALAHSRRADQVVPHERPLDCSPERVVSGHYAAFTENKGQHIGPLQSKSAITGSAAGLFGPSTVAAYDISLPQQQTLQRWLLRRKDATAFVPGVAPLNAYRLPRQKQCHPNNNRYATGLWSEVEQRQFLRGLLCYGWGQWKEIGTVVCSRYVQRR